MNFKQAVIALLDKEKQARKMNGFDLKVYRGRIHPGRIRLFASDILAQAISKVPDQIHLDQTIHFNGVCFLDASRTVLSVIREKIQIFTPKK
ncbi:hypothetical protein [Desulfobacula sp.]|uniref:hypothetical protein n=1 Tax=Desulfobacula sp. TaxID=2593537 RepID=UPI00261D376D|nr:hypothetical protein [Desulfobacula sp.]